MLEFGVIKVLKNQQIYHPHLYKIIFFVLSSQICQKFLHFLLISVSDLGSFGSVHVIQALKMHLLALYSKVQFDLIINCASN